MEYGCSHDLQVSLLVCSTGMQRVGHNSNRGSLNTSQVELAVAIVVSSMPAFASFMRKTVLESKLVSSLRSLLGSIARNGSRDATQKRAGSSPNELRPGNDPRTHGEKIGYSELNETWLMNSRVMVDIEHQPTRLQPVHEGNGVRVQRSVDMEELPCAVSQESGRGLLFH